MGNGLESSSWPLVASWLDHMLLLAVADSVCAAIGLVVLIVAGTQDLALAAEDAKRPAWDATVAVEQAYNDNVQQKEGPSQDGDFITSFTAQADYQIPKWHRWFNEASLNLNIQGHVYSRLSEFNYVEIHPEGTYRLGWDTDAVLGYLFSPRRLLSEEAGTVSRVHYRQHAINAGLRRKFLRDKRLSTQLSFVGIWDGYFGQDRGRDSWTRGPFADLRYRLGPFSRHAVEFTPRLGLGYTIRDARRANFDRDVFVVGPGFELRLPRGITFRFRYERWWRDYTVDAARDANGRNNNFKHKDDIEQYQVWLTIPVPFVDGLSLRPRYRFRAGIYDEPNRGPKDVHGRRLGLREEFDVNEVGLEIAYSF